MENETTWNNVWDMFKDIKLHTKTTGNSVVCDDNPVKRSVGYKCETTGKTWSISLSNLKASAVGNPERDKLLLDSMATPNGRAIVGVLLGCKE